MKHRQSTKEFSLCELRQIFEVLNRSEAAYQDRVKRLAEQAEDLLPRRGQQQHPFRGINRERQEVS